MAFPPLPERNGFHAELNMSQDDMIVANADGATVRADINSNLQALASTSKGNSAPSTIYAGQPWIDDNTPSTSLWTLNIYDGTDSIPAGRIDATNNRFIPFNGITGQCQLSKSGSLLALLPYDGDKLIINGNTEVVPSGGVTLATTALAADTTYYIYAYMSGTTMTLEASTTAYATSSTTGVKIKNGDATRSLVGMARTITGPAWDDSNAQRFVRSWFNDPGLGGYNAFTANRTTTGTSFAEINTEIRCGFLSWSGEVVEAYIDGAVSKDTTTATVDTSLGFDGTTAEECMNRAQSFTSTAICPLSMTAIKTGLSEGHHYATLLGKVTTSGTGTWYGGSAGARTSLKIRSRK